MDSLIARLEAAQGGSREIDAAIAAAIGIAIDESVGCFCPEFSRSIDAALTLVPSGSWWDMGTMADGRTFGASVGGPNNLFDTERCLSLTPAIAICMAAMKARAARKARGSDHA